MKRAVALVCLVTVLAECSIARANSAPVVANVTASQRGDGSKLVDINYSLTDNDNDSCIVWVAVSNNGGQTWSIPARTYSGDIGPAVSPGPNKHVVWDAGADVPGKVGTFKVRVFADDGKGAGAKVLVPAGPFRFQNGTDWVHVNSYMIDKYEVTNTFYCQFLNNADPDSNHWVGNMEIDRFGEPGNYSYAVHPGKENYPINYVNYYDAEAFAAWRSTQEGLTYRLPNPYEWEKAGAWDPIEQYYYTYGYHSNSIDSTWCNYGNHYGGPLPVGSFDGTGGKQDAHSYYGCYDISGNILEWINENAGIGQKRLRSGSWFSENLTDLRVMGGDSREMTARDSTIGFRLVLELN